MANRFTNAAKKAREATNKELASELASISRFSREQVNELLPTRNDKEAFIQLMEQVEADTAMDEKLAYLTDNIQTAGKVALQLLKVLV